MSATYTCKNNGGRIRTHCRREGLPSSGISSPAPSLRAPGTAAGCGTSHRARVASGTKGLPRHIAFQTLIEKQWLLKRDWQVISLPKTMDKLVHRCRRWARSAPSPASGARRGSGCGGHTGCCSAGSPGWRQATLHVTPACSRHLCPVSEGEKVRGFGEPDPDRLDGLVVKLLNPQVPQIAIRAV